MTANFEKPTITKSDDAGSYTIEKHPAYAGISATRIKEKCFLYGSEFVHHNSISIRINSSELHRGLSKEHYYSNKNYIEVKISESQWARFISTFNSGETPCTLRYYNGEMIPEIVHEIDKKSQFSKEADSTLQEAIDAVSRIKEMLDSVKLPKTLKNELESEVDTILRNISDNRDYVVNSFDEHMETVCDRAKIEIEAYMDKAMKSRSVEDKFDHTPISFSEK